MAQPPISLADLARKWGMDAGMVPAPSLYRTANPPRAVPTPTIRDMARNMPAASVSTYKPATYTQAMLDKLAQADAWANQHLGGMSPSAAAQMGTQTANTVGNFLPVQSVEKVLTPGTKAAPSDYINTALAALPMAGKVAGRALAPAADALANTQLGRYLTESRAMPAVNGALEGRFRVMPDAPTPQLAGPDLAVNPQLTGPAAKPQLTGPAAKPQLAGPEANNTLALPAPDKATAAKMQIVDTRGRGQQYHGARGPIDSLEEGYSNENNIYGGYNTFYTTDAADIAAGYGRKKPNQMVYAVDEKQPVNMYDMEQPQHADRWHQLFGSSPDSEFEADAIDDAQHEAGGPANLRQVMDSMRDISKSHDLTKGDVQDVFDNAIYNLQQEGFGGMSHIGGLRTNRDPHNVQIYFNPQDQLALRPVTPLSEVAPTPTNDLAINPSETPVPPASDTTPVNKARGGNISKKLAVKPKR